MKNQTTLISKSIHNLSSISLEVLLADFVQQALADSYSHNIDANLRLLDVAWEAQKLLWKMRDNIQD
ncbi:MAG: hypothetical protein ACRC62_37215 [Microcoleus sp.]